MSSKPTEELSFSEVMNKAAKSAVRGGTAGAIAMGANVGALMWMRTTVREAMYLTMYNHSILNKLLVELVEKVCSHSFCFFY